MTILSAQGLRRTYGQREVLKSATMSIDAGERVGLVGRNGSGKTTLSRILARVEEPDGGELVTRNDLHVGYLPQEPKFDPGISAVDAVLAGLGGWAEAMAEYERISGELSEGKGDMDALLDRQGALGLRIEELGGWDKSHEAEAMLGHVGISDVQALVDTMSGGEQRRVDLARLLVSAPELAILDEPTNHLDLETVGWLERYLQDRFRGALILVTHDRYLLDRVVTRTLEVEEGEVYSYEGGWGQYLAAKAEREAHDDRVQSNRRNFLRRELEWLSRTPQARSTKQKARIDRVEAVRDQTQIKKQATARIELAHSREGRSILEAEGLAIEIGGRRLVTDLELRLSKGDRLGIVGPNGCGKTTMLRTLMGELEPAAGELTRGKNTKVAFLAQTRGGLDEDASVYDNVAMGSSQIELGDQTLDARTYLERFLFNRYEQRQKVSSLSGGERARVALAKTLREGANLVILDEPTNDLDVMTLGALEGALLDYPGVILVVTHDRWFLDRIATGLLIFEDGRVTRETGGWADYLERGGGKRRKEAPKTKAHSTTIGTDKVVPAAGAKPKAKKLTYAERIELEGLLEKVDEVESKVSAIEARISEPQFYELPAKEQAEVLAELKSAKAEAERLGDRWTELEARA